MLDWKAELKDVLSEAVTPVLFYVWVITTLVVAISGPFGSFAALTFLERLAYWGGVIAASILLALGLRVFWRLALRNRRPLVEDAAVVTSLAVLFGPLLAALNRSVWPSSSQAVDWPLISGLTFLIGAGSLGWRRLNERAAARSGRGRDRILDRIESAAKGARPARLSSDNHHVLVGLNDGSEHRVLMRLRDAVAEVDREPGLYVHRSHWVALECIEAVITLKGREALRLSCGTVLPIGPKFRPDLVEAGILSA